MRNLQKIYTLGGEGEVFLMSNNLVVPKIKSMIEMINKTAHQYNILPNWFTYELFAGQLEQRIPIALSANQAIDMVVSNRNFMELVARENNLILDYSDWLAESCLGELVVNPFSDRHKLIWSNMSHDIKVAASQVAGFHIHIGVTPEDAVKIMNYCTADVIDELLALGNHSGGKRIASYRLVTGNQGYHPKFNNFFELFNYSTKNNTRKLCDNWDLIRLTDNMTVEFRTFGNHYDTQVIKRYYDNVLHLVNQAC